MATVDISSAQFQLDQLANFLGIKDGSWKSKVGKQGNKIPVHKASSTDPWSAPPISQGMMDEGAIVDMLIRGFSSDSDTHENKEIALNSSVSLYLPTLVEARISVEVPCESNIWLAALRISFHQPAFGRFSREHPLGPKLLEWMFKYVCDKLEDEPDEWLKKASTKEIADRVQILGRDAWLVRNMIFLHPTPTPTCATSGFPIVSSSTTSITFLLAALAARNSSAMNTIAETRYARPRNQQERELKVALGQTGETLGMLFLTLDGKFSEEQYNTAEGWKEAMHNLWGALPWLRCEATLVLPGGPERCEKQPGDETMMACGRCKAVRYCSPEHQKIHWKSHKTVCHAPRW